MRCSPFQKSVLLFVQVTLTVMASRLRRVSRGSVCVWSTAQSSPAGPQELHNGPCSLWESGAWGSLRVNGEKLARGAAVSYRSCVYTPPCWHTPRGEKHGAYGQKQQPYKTIERIPSVSPQVSLQSCLSVSVFVKERIRIHSSVLLTYLLKCSSLFSIRLRILSHYYKPRVYAAVYHSADAKVLVTQITALHSMITVMG